jgi:hypothetical protein
MTKHTQVGQRVGWRKAAATAILEAARASEDRVFDPNVVSVDLGNPPELPSAP